MPRKLLEKRTYRLLRNLSLLLVALFFLGTLVWKSFHGVWEAACEADIPNGRPQLMIPLEPAPIWSGPPAVTFSRFETAFSENLKNPSQAGPIVVYQKWDWWLTELLGTWLLGVLVIVPAAFFYFPGDRMFGVIERVGSGLILGAVGCVLTWTMFGGWGAPAPLFFGFAGLVSGGIWAVRYARKRGYGEEPQ